MAVLQKKNYYFALFLGSQFKKHRIVFSDIFIFNKKYNNNQITIEEAEKVIAERQSAIGDDSQQSDTIPNIAKIAVNVSDSVKDNENKLTIQNENHFEQFWTHYTPIEQKDGRVVSKGSKGRISKTDQVVFFTSS